ncbi:MAG: amino acid adenylation domain-containing protein [Betaproteobacteria bacterium]|nr:amino acid adenylation domain-containing protein [Betaproteobacteria bacterium]
MNDSLRITLPIKDAAGWTVKLRGALGALVARHFRTDNIDIAFGDQADAGPIPWMRLTLPLDPGQHLEPFLASVNNAVPMALTAGNEPLAALLWRTNGAGSEVTLPDVAGSVPILLVVTPQRDELACEWRFDGTRLQRPAVERLAARLAAFVQGAAPAGNPALSTLLGAPAAERALISKWNATETEFPAIETVVEMFERQAQRTPKATAVRFRTASLSYRELDAAANRLSRYLVGLGVAPDARVAICIDRRLEMVIAVVAILKAGGAYLPLDPAYPKDRLQHMMSDGSPVVLLTETALLPAVAAVVPTGVRVIDVQREAAVWQAESADGPPSRAVAAKANNLAYVIYTSGSTGLPKGVAMPHRALVNLLQWQLAEPAFTAARRTLQFAALGFDVAFQEIFSTLSSGGELVLIDEETRFSARALYEYVLEEKIERVFVPFVALQLLADGHALHAHGNSQGTGRCALKEVITAGEQVRVDDRVRRLFTALPGCRLINQYGPTESHVVTRFLLPETVAEWPTLPSIGGPIANAKIHILDEMLVPLPIGVAGELYIAGISLARGYLNRDELSAERFVADPFATDPGARMYKTGDLAAWRDDGNIEYLGRNDFQVKIRGFRVELGEIEAHLATHPAVRDVAVVAREDTPGVKRLVAYFTSKEPVGADALRKHCAAGLPDYMVPALFLVLDAMPVTPNGKLDRRGLPAPGRSRPELSVAFQAPVGAVEVACAMAFSELLAVDGVGRNDNFFELGGSSLLAVQVLENIRARLGRTVSAPILFAHPTPAAIARRMEGGESHPTIMSPVQHGGPSMGEPIAIIGMAGRFPGAANIEELWQNLVDEKDCITRFENNELDPSLDPRLTGDPGYVRARGVLADVELFDAAFFGIPAREAEVLDPQQRLFLEICWECLETAGYVPNAAPGAVGVFAGTHTPGYLRHHVLTHPEVVERVGDLQVMFGNDKDYIATRVAFKLNLKGPAVSINTACSTSLVAICHAVDSLRAGRCDIALAGGAAVAAPWRSGYLYEEGAMLSADGITRSFDAAATGTVFSDGAAVVLLKRLDRAIADGDTVHAVIRGVGLNNDGGEKASFTAPSVDGQAGAIVAALRDANVDPTTISYIETHGTATPMGDPIEFEALTAAHRFQAQEWVRAHAVDAATPKVGYCRIGSVKSNVGHLIAAAGVTGLIKTALALERETLPASLHFTQPNPRIAFADGPFVVNGTRTPWARSADAPRRAGVSSFGVGGTNAHVIVEEAPLAAQEDTRDAPALLRLSARSAAALDSAALRLADHIESRPQLRLVDAAMTLHRARAPFAHRLAVSAGSREAAIESLRSKNNAWRTQRELPEQQPEVVFVFPGQGAQYAGMGRVLYDTEPVYRACYDECLAALSGTTDIDLKAVAFSDNADAMVATRVTQPATFCLEVALGRLWMSRGLMPAAMIGHSVGEFAAAVIAGIMSLGDAARLVATRGALMQALPTGSMLSVRLAASRLEPLIPAGLSLAAENGPQACVVAGATSKIEAFAAELAKQDVVSRALQTSHAFHSAMMDPAIEPFLAAVKAIRLSAPSLPIISTVTGKRLTIEQATSPQYWAEHLRQPVRFSPAVIEALSRNGEESVTASRLFLEIGPRGTLSTLVRQHAQAGRPPPMAVPSLADSPATETAALALATGALWTAGIDIDDDATLRSAHARRVALPTYPFERRRFWLDTIPRPAADAAAAVLPPAISIAGLHNTIQPTLPITSMNPVPASTPAASRKPQLIKRLRTMFEDVSGSDLSGADENATFIELGLDSLTLTQAAIQLKKTFSVKVTFRQLMESYRNLDALAGFLDASLPPETASQAAAPAALPPAVMPSTGIPIQGGGLVQQVIQQQMQIMAQQLALLGGGGGAGAWAPAPAPVPAAAQAGPAHEAAPAADAGDAPVKSVAYDVKKAFGAIARIHTQKSDLTELQKSRLEAFTRRYTMKTRKSKEYTAEHRPHLADPRVVNNFRPQTKEITYQVVVDRSKGSRLWDIDGNEYVDALNGFGMSLFGWQPEFVQKAISAQFEAGYEIGPMHPLAGDVAKLVCELTGFDRAGLCNTGSEAVMAAIRVARTVTGRSLIVSFAGSYHGTFDEVIVRAGRNHKGIPGAPGIMSEMFGNIMVLDYGTPESIEVIRAHADELAAVLVEPVQSRRPDFQPVEFLKTIREITEKSCTCLIFDEVITGFRSHQQGTQGLFGIRADLSSYGKVIGGGYPIGVIAGKRAYMDALDGGAWQYGDDSIPTVGVTYFAGTFVRHPLALAAAKASLEHMKSVGPALQADLNRRTAEMAAEMNAFCKRRAAPVEVKHFASLWRTTFTEDHSFQDLLFPMMRNRGIHILDNFPCFLTTAHTDADIALIVSAFKESIAELQEAGLISGKPDERARTFDASQPPVSGARLGKDPSGAPAWFVPNPDSPGKYMKLEA